LGTLDNEFVKFGRTVSEVMKHHGRASDIDLMANIGFILLDKEERKGLHSFTRGERFVAAVQGMSREVNNGGWDQFFRNSSGALAFDLQPALEAMGSKENLSIARRALERFGKPVSLEEEDRWEHLDRVRGDADDNPWEDLEDEFYENPEDLDAMMLRYIAAHPAEFRS
jgi:Domain of unknown function (DUF4375)